MIDVGVGVFPFQVGLGQPRIEGSLSADECHVADLVEGAEGGVDEEVLVVSPKSNILNFDSVYVKMLEVGFVQHLMQVLL